jgi:hypothetical protein
MDPISLILGALAAGATASLQETAGQAVKDAYAGLKALLIRKFENKPVANTALEEHEKQPEVWEKPLEQALKEANADQDEDVVQAAQRLLTLINPQQAQAGKYNVNITGDVQGFVQGDNARVKMNFGDESKKK